MRGAAFLGDLVLFGPQLLALHGDGAALAVEGDEPFDVHGHALGLGTEREAGGVFTELLEVDHGVEG